MSGRSLEPSFGLLFGDLLRELHVETTGAAIVLSTMDAVINFSGLLVGPLVKRLTYRKVAIGGCLLSSIGLVGTSMAASVTHIIITYSIIGGLGIGLMIACTFVGLHIYFDKKKGQAVGLAMAGTALGYMAMPQIVSFLLLRYDFQGTLLILGALALNSVVGGSLFQPVKWHLKRKEVPIIKEDIIQIPEEKEVNGCEQLEEGDQVNQKLLGIKRSLNKECSVRLTDSDHVLRKCSVPIGSNRKASIVSSVPKVKSLSDCTQHCNNSANKTLHQVSSATVLRKLSLVSNVSNMDFIGSAMHIAYDTDDERGLEMNFNKKSNNKLKKVLKDPRSTCWTSFFKIMGFDLLGDMVYLNIVFGIAVLFVADLHFRMIMPFYMTHMEYTKQEVATVLSSMAIADILSRIVMPLILDRLPCSRRLTLLICCIFVAISRSILALQEEMLSFIIVAVINGFIRGMTLINIPLVLSEYATKDNFPSVLGLSMVARGIFIVFLGPLGGYIRDYTNSYPICIHGQSVLVLLCALAWSIEYLIKRRFH
uniref:Putative monocarboxylate transporter 4-like isoform x1 n=1 Tax=Triatoma dimidiata TaxID=72491 RepID=A0A0V0G6D4_TRIDM